VKPDHLPLAAAPLSVNRGRLLLAVGWLVKVKLPDPSEADSLMSAGEYQATLG
jgi:glycine cleavage system H lipoate-binding protein